MIPGVTNSPLCTKNPTDSRIWSKQIRTKHCSNTHKKLVLEMVGVFHMHTYNLTKYEKIEQS